MPARSQSCSQPTIRTRFGSSFSSAPFAEAATSTLRANSVTCKIWLKAIGNSTTQQPRSGMQATRKVAAELTADHTTRLCWGNQHRYLWVTLAGRRRTVPSAKLISRCAADSRCPTARPACLRPSSDDRRSGIVQYPRGGGVTVTVRRWSERRRQLGSRSPCGSSRCAGYRLP